MKNRKAANVFSLGESVFRRFFDAMYEEVYDGYGDMELDILNKGCRVGMLAGLTVCLIAMVVKMIAGISYYDVYAIYCFMVGGQWFYKWVRLKKKSDLCYCILWCGMAIGFFVGYFVEIF